MSDKTRHVLTVAKVVVACGLVSCSVSAAADDEELPDLEFLEYLGSWESSDEEWLFFDAEDAEDGETAAREESPRNDRVSDSVSKSAPLDEESTELEKNEG